MDETGADVAVLSSFLAVAFNEMATLGYKIFFNRRKFNQELIEYLKETFIAFSLIVDSAEEKQFAREEVRKWLLELKDATCEAEDVLDAIQIEYQAHQSKAVTEDQERSSSSQDPLKQVIEPKLRAILGRLEDLRQESDAFGLRKAGEESRSSEKTETTSSSAPPPSFEFDVFLNFRGDDVRYGFLYNLKDALQQKEIKSFYDVEDLRKGAEIEKILEKISVSKMSIMIFSKDYASSSYCLEELVKIFECKKRWGHKVLPVFYHVAPDVVADESGIYGEAFRRHEEKGTDSEKARTWRVSLAEAASLSGFVLENKRPEKYDIQEIVEAVKKILEAFDSEKRLSGNRENTSLWLKDLMKVESADFGLSKAVEKTEKTCLIDEYEGFDSGEANKEAIMDKLISDDDYGSNPGVRVLTHDLRARIVDKGAKSSDKVDGPDAELMTGSTAGDEEMPGETKETVQKISSSSSSFGISISSKPSLSSFLKSPYGSHLSVLFWFVIPVLLATLLAYITISPKIQEDDVFLSFNGEEPSNADLLVISTQLHSALHQESISTFMAFKEKRKVLKAIDRSRVAVIILSQGYASCRRCLEELAMVIEGHQGAHGKTVIPILYKSSRQDLLQQNEEFAKGFLMHRENVKHLDKVYRWRYALSQAINLPGGWDYSSYSSESELISNVVQDIAAKLRTETESSSTATKGKVAQRWVPVVPLLVFCALMATITIALRALEKSCESDVFVNCSGEHDLLSKLSHYLEENNIRTFKYEGLVRKNITRKIRKGIQRSKAAIIVITEGYANSPRCLDELVEIIECHRATGLAIVPVRYNVQQPFLEDSIRNLHIGSRRVQSWEKALNEAASMTGWIYGKPDDDFEVLLGEIYKEVKRKLEKMEASSSSFGLDGPPPLPADAASASASSSSSLPRSVQLKKNGVFLSFRRADVHYNFVSHLYDALCLQGIPTFLDKEELDRGKPIWETLEAISKSNIAVVVFSENYANSTFCLDELVMIMECKETQGLVVLPIFYKVDPDDVASQTGCFAKAFEKHVDEKNEEGRSRAMRWRTAMKEAANLSGWDLRNIWSESTAIEEIVKDISRKLGYQRLNNFQGLVGIISQIERVEYLLNAHSNDTRVVGIWGMGGSGKTTLAKCVYERNAMYFEGSCFLSAVREKSQRGGLQQLQSDLLGNVFGSSNATMNRLLRHRKVLIVLDDVDSYQQFESLVGGRDWIAEGSKIIITSRDKNVLDNVVDSGYMFKVPALAVQEALQLFIFFAFRRICPDNEYVKLSNAVVSYAQGNPLALKVLGLFFHNRSKQEWKSSLEKLKRTMNKDILEVLKISYDGLDNEEKEIFLHISCFLRGKRESEVQEILDACGFVTSIGLRVLIDKALIKMWNDKIEMHDLLQEMGQEIVRLECVDDPGKRSRLWNHNEISRVFAENSGTGSIRGLFLDISAISALSLAPTTFANMDQVELLKFYGFVDRYDEYFPRSLESQFNDIQLPRGLKSLPSSLKYLYWECYPLKSFPSKFCPENLAVIDMPCSKFKRLWIGEQNLVNLKVIRLRRCRHLIGMPNLSSAHNLVTIDCSRCESLLEVPPSISCLGKLEKLDFSNCIKIRRFPSTKGLGSLESLLLGGCSALSTFPEVSTNIKELDLGNTAIEEVPESIKSLCQLQSLHLSGCRRLENLPAAVSELVSLTGLSIGPSINVENLNTTLSSFPLLSKLSLCGDSFDALPTSITQLSRLGMVLLFTCTRLRSLPNLPPCLNFICALDCTSLQTVPRLSFELAEGWERNPCYRFFFLNCPRLDHSSRRNIQKHWQQAILHLANAVNRHPDHQRLSMRDEVYAICPGSEIPQWFKTQNRGYSIDIDLPSGWHNENFLGFSLCAVIGPRSQQVTNDDHLRITWKCRLGSNHGDSTEADKTLTTWIRRLESQHVFTFYSSLFHRIVTTDRSNQWSGNYYNKASFEVFLIEYSERNRFEVNSCAVRLLYSGNDKDDSHSVV